MWTTSRMWGINHLLKPKRLFPLCVCSGIPIVLSNQTNITAVGLWGFQLAGATMTTEQSLRSALVPICITSWWYSIWLGVFNDACVFYARCHCCHKASPAGRLAFFPGGFIFRSHGACVCMSINVYCIITEHTWAYMSISTDIHAQSVVSMHTWGIYHGIWSYIIHT